MTAAFVGTWRAARLPVGKLSLLFSLFAMMILIIIHTNIQLFINGVIYRHMESGSSSGRHIVLHCGNIYFL